MNRLDNIFLTALQAKIIRTIYYMTYVYGIKKILFINHIF